MAVADADIYQNTRASIFAFCKKTIEDLNMTNDFQMFDFDAHATIEELPPKHLIGVAEFAMQNDDRLYSATCLIAVCTLSTDKDIEILRTVISRLFTSLVPGKTVSRISSTTGSQVGQLTVKGNVETMPVTGTKGRPLMAVAVEFGTNFVAPPV